MTEPIALDAAAVRRIAVQAALLSAADALHADGDGVLGVVRHFGSLQLDPTRTVERTHLLVLWSRLGRFPRPELDRVLWNERRLLEHNAHLVPIERLPELRHEAGPWISRWEGVRSWIDVNRAFHDSILDQLRDRGPLLSRDIDDSSLVAGWRSTGWSHGRNTTRMLEFMGKALEVLVTGRDGQERRWDLAERVIPTDAPATTLDDDQYAERRLAEAMARFGVADLAHVRTRTYWVDKRALARTIDRFVAEGRMLPVRLPDDRGKRPAWVTPEALAAAGDAVGGRATGSRTTLLSPFDPLIYDRERTSRFLDFDFKLEMYVPRGERKFGHFTLPVLHDNRLVARLDSMVDRKRNVLVVNGLHWERPEGQRVRRAVDAAIADLAAFAGAAAVVPSPLPVAADPPQSDSR